MNKHVTTTHSWNDFLLCLGETDTIGYGKTRTGVRNLTQSHKKNQRSFTELYYNCVAAMFIKTNGPTFSSTVIQRLAHTLVPSAGDN